ncbi:epidermal growth factor-like protein 7 isoform X2 [Gouania willdenowi]|uniref:epidermal growth factor-like protein 7 isoform X2 n=1 Tax=Gouania willdenowi TaxID=441366 RepID=UPI0010563694|nr:epidermal growth factor-like protein 7 isoform X2 [Gouania willdenowi]
MYQTLLLSSSLFILHVTATPHFGRRVCARDLRHSVVMVTESSIQPVHKPYITLCQGHRLCSTYKTTYSVVYRQVSRVGSYPECCPGWRRFHSHSCNQALCGQPCVNGGTCVRPNQCACPLGWAGHHCQTDVDECSEQQPCSQRCINTDGSFRCSCRDGFRLDEDGRSCQRSTLATPTQATAAGSGLGLVENVTEEVQSLRNRVELLEKKLQLVLAPFSSFFPLSLDDGLSEKTTVLSHSFQQLDRIDSLSEQIGFLEERLGTCSCQEN